jgi:protein gp37
MGVSVESEDYTDRIDYLRATSAFIKFLSLEPLLGPPNNLNLAGIDWAIAGGESGPAARPMNPDWVRSIRDQCVDAGVAFHFKQWGGVQKKANRSRARRANLGRASNRKGVSLASMILSGRPVQMVSGVGDKAKLSNSFNELGG